MYEIFSHSQLNYIIAVFFVTAAYMYVYIILYYIYMNTK